MDFPKEFQTQEHQAVFINSVQNLKEKYQQIIPEIQEGVNPDSEETVLIPYREKLSFDSSEFGDKISIFSDLMEPIVGSLERKSFPCKTDFSLIKESVTQNALNNFHILNQIMDNPKFKLKLKETETKISSLPKPSTLNSTKLEPPIQTLAELILNEGGDDGVHDYDVGNHDDDPQDFESEEVKNIRNNSTSVKDYFFNSIDYYAANADRYTNAGFWKNVFK